MGPLDCYFERRGASRPPCCTAKIAGEMWWSYCSSRCHLLAAQDDTGVDQQSEAVVRRVELAGPDGLDPIPCPSRQPRLTVRQNARLAKSCCLARAIDYPCLFEKWLRQSEAFSGAIVMTMQVIPPVGIDIASWTRVAGKLWPNCGPFLLPGHTFDGETFVIQPDRHHLKWLVPRARPRECAPG